MLEKFIKKPAVNLATSTIRSVVSDDWIDRDWLEKKLQSTFDQILQNRLSKFENNSGKTTFIFLLLYFSGLICSGSIFTLLFVANNFISQLFLASILLVELFLTYFVLICGLRWLLRGVMCLLHGV